MCLLVAGTVFFLTRFSRRVFSSRSSRSHGSLEETCLLSIAMRSTGFHQQKSPSSAEEKVSHSSNGLPKDYRKALKIEASLSIEKPIKLHPNRCRWQLWRRIPRRKYAAFALPELQLRQILSLGTRPHRSSRRAPVLRPRRATADSSGRAAAATRLRTPVVRPAGTRSTDVDRTAAATRRQAPG